MTLLLPRMYDNVQLSSFPSLRSTAAEAVSPFPCCPPGCWAPTPPTCTFPPSVTPEGPNSGNSSCLTNSNLLPLRPTLPDQCPPRSPRARCRRLPTGAATAGTTAATWRLPPPQMVLYPRRRRSSFLHPEGPTRGLSRMPPW